MAKPTAKQLQAIVKEVVDNFEVDGTSDYARMDASIHEATGLRFDNASVWALVNRAKASVERISFSLED
jgi:hypothetical protein